MFKISAFLSVFIELFCYFKFFFVHIISFLVDLYPCMIILKYNQTFGVLISFIVFITPPVIFLLYIYFMFLSLYSVAFYLPLLLQICTVTPMPIGVGRVFKEVCYLQSNQV